MNLEDAANKNSMSKALQIRNVINIMKKIDNYKQML